MSVLVVDDQAVNRVVIGALLRSLNLDVIEATNGREGLLAYLRHGRERIAFVFLDLVMPVWDGFRAALSIRSAENQRGWQQVPIVAYTSEDVQHGSPLFDKCMASGFNGVVPKPMNRRDATQLLSRWLPSVSGQPASSGSRHSAGSSDEEAQCSCSQPGCGPCRVASATSTGAVASGMQGVVDSRSTGFCRTPDGGGSSSSAAGCSSASLSGSAEAGGSSDGAGGGRSNATSERRWLPCWAASQALSG
ncbi:hypothetical protein COHA_007140 [Chlorella ohadii]|uniref:Response regulatory domain-containing protein n=1 Tax=Chlorella ohadii TaxID=2649997 RepID=A0AAD5H4K3_9CHLO|nr:hypothetical protein COHA_007140 [Chlorella ohadii]